MIPSAYVHVPFCQSICTYCAFFRSARKDWIDPWLERITREISAALKKARKENPDFFLKTVYIGGGTPSLLDEEQLDRLLGCFDGYTDPEGEWTMEANPESITREKLALARAHGVSRLSIGLQTFDEKRLASLGRHHSAAVGRQAVEMAKAAGFDSISVDLMYGFWDQSLSDLQKDLDAFLELDVDHLSIYSLILEPDSIFGRQHMQEIDEEMGALMYEAIEERLEKAGYVHYEVSSYARNEKYGLHNTLIWEDGLYYGFGCGAIGRDEGGLCHYEGSLKDYIENKGQRVREFDASPWFDALMTGLRTIWGVDLRAWQNRYHKDFLACCSPVLQKYPDGLRIEGGRLKTTSRGREILDSILVDFLMLDC